MILEAMKAHSLGQISKEEVEQRSKIVSQALRAELENMLSLQKSNDSKHEELKNRRGRIPWSEVPSFHVEVIDNDLNEVPIEDSDPEKYRDTPDSVRHYRHLYAHGDYTKLKLIVCSEKMDYYPGDPVYLKFYVRNDSNGAIHIDKAALPRHYAYLWKLFHSNDDEVEKTPKWEKDSQIRPSTYVYNPRTFVGGPISIIFDYIKLQPGQRWELDTVSLNQYYMLSKPDAYKLTCFQTSFIDNQCYETPLQSNTLTFRILDPMDSETPRPSQRTQGIPYTPPSPTEYVVTKTEREMLAKANNLTLDEANALPFIIPVPPKPKDNIPFTNPPPGEEVFEQPALPNNVFPLHINAEPYYVFLDASPYDYYRQKAKEAEAAKTEPERPVE